MTRLAASPFNSGSAILCERTTTNMQRLATVDTQHERHAVMQHSTHLETWAVVSISFPNLVADLAAAGMPSCLLLPVPLQAGCMHTFMHSFITHSNIHPFNHSLNQSSVHAFMHALHSCIPAHDCDLPARFTGIEPLHTCHVRWPGSFGDLRTMPT